MAVFDNLYSYNQGNGTVSVIPDVSTVKAKIETAFQQIFGEEVSTDTTTPMGRFIEALTLLFIDVLGVNVQNANSFNPNHAVGNYLDSIGALFGITRPTGATDADYRRLIVSSQSRGAGFVQSIRQALSNVEGVTSVCVIENGHGDAAIIDGISLPAHSIFVCVGGSTYSDGAVAEAIYATKSAGCGYQIDTSHGTLVQHTVTDQQTGSTTNVYFHRASQRPVSVAVVVDGSAYTGTDIVATVKNAVIDVVNKHSINSSVTSAMIASAISASGTGIVCTGVAITSDGSPADPFVTLPYQYANIGINDITVTI